MNRRAFIQTTTLGAVAANVALSTAHAAEPAPAAQAADADEITRVLARYIVTARHADLPDAI